jgi:N-methylhydantoinase A
MERFDEAHLNLFAVNQPGFPIEIVTWRGEGRIIRAKPSLTGGAAPAPSSGEVALSSRTGWFGGAPVQTAIHRVEDMSALTEIAGPAVIEEPTTTIVLDPGSVALVRPTHYLVEIAAVENQAELAESLRIGA